jgi:prepilin-type N-terminal cleavage/methylation domain-containing protein/prepilin-type processing-associated H-X9-DG protein
MKRGLFSRTDLGRKRQRGYLFIFCHDAADGGFTLIELLVVLAIIAILAGLSYAGIMVALKRAHATACLSNLQNIGVATQLYANDTSGQLPFYGNSADDPVPQALLFLYLTGAATTSTDPNAYQYSPVWKCPGDNAAVRSSYYQWNSYGVNYNLANMKLQELHSPSSTMWMADCDGEGETTVVFDIDFLDTATNRARHNRILNILYVDGHVEGLLVIPDSTDTFWTGQMNPPP